MSDHTSTNPECAVAEGERLRSAFGDDVAMLDTTAGRVESPDIAGIVEPLTDPDRPPADRNALGCIDELGSRSWQRRAADDQVVRRIDSDDGRGAAVRDPERTPTGCETTRDGNRVRGTKD